MSSFIIEISRDVEQKENGSWQGVIPKDIAIFFIEVISLILGVGAL
jgi:hypothetical protein